MFVAALLLAVKIRKQSKSLSTNEWIKMWHIYTIEYHLPMRKEEILSFEITQMDLKGIMLMK